MDQQEIERSFRALETRVTAIEQILPTLLTRQEFETAMAKVATKDDLAALRDELRTEMASKRDLAELREELRRHFDVVAESLRADIHLLVEGHTYLVARLDGSDRRMDIFDRRTQAIELRTQVIERRTRNIERRTQTIERRTRNIERRTAAFEHRLERRALAADRRFLQNERRLKMLEEERRARRKRSGH